jgi:predicted Zn-dependent protease
MFSEFWFFSFRKLQFENGVVGKALKGPICTYEYSGGVNSDHSVVHGLVATTIAHEIGHNLGMEHDTAECECPNERCVMASSSG